VLRHEAAHAVLHGDTADPLENRAQRGIRETEAESVAYVLASLLGLDLGASSITYTAGWSRTELDALGTAAMNVLRGVNTIAAGLGLANTETDQQRGAA
jgi:hypothetical protein